MADEHSQLVKKLTDAYKRIYGHSITCIDLDKFRTDDLRCMLAGVNRMEHKKSS